jgi:hypothetical protein
VSELNSIVDSNAKGVRTLDITETLADPYPEHVQLEEAMVDDLAPVQVHEEVIDEAAHPRAQGAEEVTPREEAEFDLGPRKERRHRQQYVEDRHGCNKKVTAG